jgi:hypothetical protein
MGRLPFGRPRPKGEHSSEIFLIAACTMDGQSMQEKICLSATGDSKTVTQPNVQARIFGGQTRAGAVAHRVRQNVIVAEFF